MTQQRTSPTPSPRKAITKEDWLFFKATIYLERMQNKTGKDNLLSEPGGRANSAACKSLGQTFQNWLN